MFAITATNPAGTLAGSLMNAGGLYREKRPEVAAMLARTRAALATLKAWGGPPAAELCAGLAARLKLAQAYPDQLSADAALLERLAAGLPDLPPDAVGANELRVQAALGAALADEISRRSDADRAHPPLVIDFAPFQMTRTPGEIARVARPLAEAGQPLADLVLGLTAAATALLGVWGEMLFLSVLRPHEYLLMNTHQLGESLGLLAHGLQTVAREYRAHQSLTFTLRPYPDPELPGALYFELMVERPQSQAYRVVPPARIAAATLDQTRPLPSARAGER